MTVRLHTQTLKGGPDVPLELRGDCARACITSVLGLPIEAISNTHGPGWYDALCSELEALGYALVEVDVQYEPPRGLWIPEVPSLNLGVDANGKQPSHSVVARGYDLIHDPALGQKYDAETWPAAWNDDKILGGWALAPLDPVDSDPLTPLVAPPVERPAGLPVKEGDDRDKEETHDA